MTDCIELAGQLGKALAASPQAAALRAARQAFELHPELARTLEEYQKQIDRISELESQNKPIEVADKQRLQELNGKLVSAEAFKKLTAAQVEYVDLMRKVNDRLRHELAETEM